MSQVNEAETETETETRMPYADRDRSWLERELATAQLTSRTLIRRIEKMEQQLAETTRAYNKTVTNMMEIVRENLALTSECERWRAQAVRTHQDALGFEETFSFANLTLEEAQVIRKAIARLHHPDVGGSPERMKSWNSILDRIEERYR